MNKGAAMTNQAQTSAHPELIQNIRVVAHDCRWCGAEALKFSAHSNACPVGERYQQVQQRGGVPMAPLHGAALLEFFR
jgi:hypothetical protein